MPPPPFWDVDGSDEEGVEESVAIGTADDVDDDASIMSFVDTELSTIDSNVGDDGDADGRCLWPNE